MTQTATNREFISFRIGSEEFCTDIMSVREIRGWSPATEVPHAPSYVRGVINLRGTVLPIIDLASRLGVSSDDEAARRVIIVVQVRRQIVGLLVHAVSDILSIAESEIQPTPDIASGLPRNFVCGLIALEGRMIGVIAIEEVLPPLGNAAA